MPLRVRATWVSRKEVPRWCCDFGGFGSEAILGLSDFQRWWYRRVRHVIWPAQSRFFQDWEQAKDWLVNEN
jgi:hypothetical protein